MKTNTKTETETKTVVDTLLEDASLNEVNKRTLTEAEAIKLVDKHYEEVTSKNGMLKLLRSLNYSISMNRVFKIYTDYTLLKTKLSKEIK